MPSPLDASASRCQAEEVVHQVQRDPRGTERLEAPRLLRQVLFSAEGDVHQVQRDPGTVWLEATRLLRQVLFKRISLWRTTYYEDYENCLLFGERV